MGLNAYEGAVASGIEYIDWVFARPLSWTGIDIEISAQTQECWNNVTTLAATLVKPTSALLNGNNTGSCELEWVGLVYGLTDEGDPGSDVAPADSLWDGYVVTNDDTPYTQGTTFSISTADGNLTPLSAETCYWCRAWGNSPSGVNDYGDAVWFCTGSEDYSHGIVVPSQSYPTGLTQFLFRNCGDGNITVTIGSSLWVGGTSWTPSDDGSPGINIIGIKAGVSGGSYNVVVRYTAPFNTLVANMGNGTYQEWGYTLYTPTNTSTDGVVKYGNITLYMEAL